MFSYLKKLINILRQNNIKIFYFLIFISLFITFLEILIISALPGLFQIINEGEISTNYNKLFKLKEFFNTKLSNLHFIVLTLIILSLLKFIVSLIYLNLSTKYIFLNLKKITTKIYENILSKEYLEFIKKDTSHYLKNIINEPSFFSSNVFLPFFLIIPDIIILISYLVFLTIYNLEITLFVSVFLIFVSYFYFSFYKTKLSNFIEQRQISNENFIKIVKDSFSLFKEIKFLKFDLKFLSNLKIYLNNFFNPQKKVIIITQTPRIFMEFIGIVLIGTIIIFSDIIFDDQNIIVSLGVFFVILIKLIPIFNKLVSNIQILNSQKKVLNEIYESIKVIPNKKEFFKLNNFKKEIKMNLNFDYEKKVIFKNLNFNIYKNQIVGLIGKSGSGKTTLIDILLGLIKMPNGKIFIDDIDVSNKHLDLSNLMTVVPQNIHLLNSSLKNNITLNFFTEDNIDQNRLNKSIVLAGLKNLVDNKGVDMIVGENGTNLSGGQSQRIGIARAIYQNKKIIIFDEFTSSLDDETESKIIESLIKLKRENLTMVISTHKKKLLDICDTVYDLSNNENN
ncbi:ATP-binding cassette domain-containing protein [Candidatus Pelagibacter sp. HIMB1493]|uniref:ATP-binding cassette domain-containing protein n=1 Tax=Candidatus Pelagibacter sp. HIMB1493 TaxID=3413334 RepID=UPI003F828BB0